jgi:DNA-binding MarR family transcriptional regulator
LLREELALKTAKLRALEDGTWRWIEVQEVHRRPVTAASLAEHFGITVHAARDRLKRLVDRGLMTREPLSGRRGESVYRTVLWLDGISAERAAEILRRRRGGLQGLGLHDLLWAALAGYEAQYAHDSIGKAHPELPPGCIERIDSLVTAARDLVAWSHPHGSWS